MSFGSMAKLYTKVEEGVKTILTLHPDARDSNMVLVLRYWQQIQGIRIADSVREKLLKYGVHPETISRVKRELQARHPELAPSSDAQAKKADQGQQVWGMFHERKGAPNGAVTVGPTV